MTRTAALSFLAVVLLGITSGCGGGGGAPPPAPLQYGLTVNRGGTGQGTVTGSGISCGPSSSTCSNTYAAGTVVTLSASASAGSTFAGWSGPCSGTGACTLTMNSAASVTATFTATSPGGHTLTVSTAGNGAGTITSSPAGISCPGTCSASFASGTTVTMTATPAAGSVLVIWSGACTGTGASCPVTMDVDRSTTVTFTRPVLTIATIGDGAGTITSTPPGIACSSGSSTGCSASFDQGASVTLTSTTAATASFPGWPDPCWGVQGPCTFTINSDTNLSITFSGWKVQRPFPTALYGAAVLGATRIAVGGGGAVVTSTDSISWAGHPLTVFETLRAVAVDATGGLAVAVGDLGTILTSTDGAAWTSRSSGTTANLRGVARGGSVFVAVGVGGVVLTSADGIGWTPQISGTTVELLSVGYGGGQFVATGFAGTVLTSTDGLAWASRTSNTTQYLTGVAYDAGGFIAVGSAGAVVTSPDAVTWTARTPFTASVLVGITARAGSYAAADGAQVIYTSSDGLTWTAHSAGAFAESNAGIATLGGELHVLGLRGSIARSSDGAAWALMLAPTGTGPENGGITDAAYGNSTYVLVGAYGAIFTSTDGEAWTSRRADLGASNAGLEVAFGGGAFVAVSPNGIHRSVDAITWTTVSGSPGLYGGYIAYQEAKGFVVVGVPSYPNPSPVLTSPDGTTWTTQGATGITQSLEAISCSPATCVALGAAGVVYSNAAPGAGGAWTPWTSPISTGGWQSGIAFGSSVFVVPVATATYTSTDGSGWSGPHPVTPATGKMLAYGNGQFMATNIMTSPDGLAWTLTTRPSVRGDANADSTFFSVNAAAFGHAGWIAGKSIRTTSAGAFVILKHP